MKIILVTHGDFAKSILASAQMILGEQENIDAFGLHPKDDVDTLRSELEANIKATDSKEEILFLTDMFSGSPFNVVVSLMGKYPIYHITGLNMPLLLEVLMARNSNKKTCEEICENVITTAKDAIRDVRQYLREAI